MGRSIHRTRRDLAELARDPFLGLYKHRVTELINELQKKRRIKNQVHDRRRAGEHLPHTPIETIPIQEFEASRHNHFPAGPEDIRAVLQSLPPGTADGLDVIELRAGVQNQREYVLQVSDSSSVPDPLTGRQGIEMMPGVFSPPALGCYLPARNLIYLFAYVYEPDIAHREIVEFYLRLQMLSTFVHEVAHHFDCTSRVDRDRWRADDRDKGEIYAETVQREWLAQYVVPYLETTYRDQAAELQSWLTTQVGTVIPLHLLAGDPRSTARDGQIITAAFFNTSRAFEDLIAAVVTEQCKTKTRIEFARDLHYAEEYDIPERILKSVLDENPKDADAIALTADIAAHRGDNSLAVDLAERACAIEKDHLDALLVLTYVFRRAGDWNRLLKTAQRLLERGSHDMYDIIWAKDCCAFARLQQGQVDKFESIVAEIEAIGTRLADRSARQLRNAANKLTE